jgi:Sulfotransferase family
MQGAGVTLQERFNPDNLIATACEEAGSDDFGDGGWRPGLERLADGLVNEARLSAIGVEIAYLDVMRALKNRLDVIAWRKAHPEVADKPIGQPIFIVGQPRTGTTILYDLLAQDPDLRAPLTWEVDAPCPVPQPETYHDDPRIAAAQASIELSEQIIPGFLAFHPMGALVGQECVRITASEFTSMIFSVQYRLPSYYRWLLYEADHAGAYRFHRIFLQHLQSGVPGQWLLKSPAHLWHLDALLAEYPDALIVQTHRDPLNVISSIAALTHHLRRMGSDESSIAECAAQSYEEIAVGLERGMALRDSAAVPAGRVIDVQFADFMKDPWSTIGGIYQKLGRSLRPEAERRMRDFLAAHPGDGGRGRYTWSDTGLDAGEVRDRVRGYQERYAVPTEPLR